MLCFSVAYLISNLQLKQTTYEKLIIVNICRDFTAQSVTSIHLASMRQ